MLVVLRVKEFPPFSWGIFVLGRTELHLYMFLRAFFLLFLTGLLAQTSAQTLGGQSAFSFLTISHHPQSSALGGLNLTHLNNDVGLSAVNPALMQPVHSGNLSTSMLRIAPGVNSLFGNGAFYLEKTSTTIGLSMNHLLYGDELQTDASGNQLGRIRAFDQYVGASASRSYGERWRYGATVKWANSQYGPFKSSALFADVGLTYTDTAHRLRLGFVARNMGTQLSTYAGQSEDIPFDISIGVSHQLAKAPIRLHLTLQGIHQFDLLYADTTFEAENYGRSFQLGTMQKAFSHLVLGAEYLVGEKLVLMLGYNALRRSELRIRNLSNGLAGFSYGIQFRLGKIDFFYSRLHYQSQLSQHQVAFTVRFANQK